MYSLCANLPGHPLAFSAAAAAWPQATPDFSGLWKQDNDRCQPKRNGDVTLRIEHHDPELTVETSIVAWRAESPARGAEVHDRWKGLRIDGSGRRRIPHFGRLEGIEPRLLDRGTRRRPHSSVERDMVAHRRWRNAPENPRTPEWRKADSLLSPIQR